MESHAHSQRKKNQTLHLHDFVLPPITTEENFIISPAFIFKLYFLKLNELSAFISINYDFSA